MIPAILIRILGPFSSLYLRSTPFQNATKYRLTCLNACVSHVPEIFIKKDNLPEHYRHHVIDTRHNRQSPRFLDKLCEELHVSIYYCALGFRSLLNCLATVFVCIVFQDDLAP